MSGMSTDIFIRVETLRLAGSFVLIIFCLLNPLSRSTDEIGIVRANEVISEAVGSGLAFRLNSVASWPYPKLMFCLA